MDTTVTDVLSESATVPRAGTTAAVVAIATGTGARTTASGASTSVGTAPMDLDEKVRPDVVEYFCLSISTTRTIGITSMAPVAIPVLELRLRLKPGHGKGTGTTMIKEEMKMISLQPLSTALSCRLAKGASTVWQVDDEKEQVLPPKVAKDLLKFWSRPSPKQNLYDCFLFAMHLADTKTHVLHSDVVEKPDKELFVGGTLRMTSNSTREEHTGLFLGTSQDKKGWYLSKAGTNMIYMAITVDMTRVMIPSPTGYTLTGTFVSEICHGCEKFPRSPENLEPDQQHRFTVLKRCGRCRAVHYCSAICQKTDWHRGHRQECPTMFRMPDENKILELHVMNQLYRTQQAAEQKELPCRSTDELLQRFRQYEADPNLDLFGQRRGTLCTYLEYKDVQSFLPAGTKQEKWYSNPCRRSPIIREIKESMTRAWDHVVNERGLNANRMMHQLEEWVWILGDHQTVWTNKGVPIPYRNFGRDRLIACCEHYGFSWQYLDKGRSE